MRKYLLTAALMFEAILVGFAQNHWVPNPYQFPTNMNVIGVIQINGFEQANEYLEIGVFYEDDEDECRGSMLLQYVEPLNRYFLYLTIYGDPGDGLIFKLFDHLSQTELNLTCNNEMTYQSNAIHGSVTNPYVFTFMGGEYCTVSVVADPPEGGTVSGGGGFTCGMPCTIMATPVPDGAFMEWVLNGEVLTTEPSYSFNALADYTFTAHFADPGAPHYHVAVEASPFEGGTVDGGGEFLEGETCIVTATPNNGYDFESWVEEGNVVSYESSYSFVVQEDHSLTAFFVRNTFTVMAVADPEEGGVIEGTGDYTEGEICTLLATANEGFTFNRWEENGVTVWQQSSLSFAVTCDRALKAIFDINPNNYLVSVSANPPEGGYAVGGGAYLEGAVCEVFAAPKPNYVFDYWTENGVAVSDEPSYSFVVSCDRTLVAEFHYYVGVEEQNETSLIYPNPTSLWLWIQRPDNVSVVPINVYDLQGHLLMTTFDNPIDLSKLAPGIYLIDGKRVVRR